MLGAAERSAPRLLQGNILSRKEEYEEKTWNLLLPVLEELGMKPVDVEYVKEGGEYYLRCYIDKDGGVGITDCEAVSRAIDPLLDRENFIDDAYTLEVSSPGLGRPLKRPRDFDYAAGKEIELRLYKAKEGQKEFRGILKNWDKERIEIETVEGLRETFLRSDLSLIRLAYDFE